MLSSCSAPPPTVESLRSTSAARRGGAGAPLAGAPVRRRETPWSGRCALTHAWRVGEVGSCWARAAGSPSRTLGGTSTRLPDPRARVPQPNPYRDLEAKGSLRPKAGSAWDPSQQPPVQRKSRMRIVERDASASKSALLTPPTGVAASAMLGSMDDRRVVRGLLVLAGCGADSASALRLLQIPFMRCWSEVTSCARRRYSERLACTATRVRPRGVLHPR